MNIYLHDGTCVRIKDFKTLETLLFATLKKELPEEAQNVEAIKIIFNQIAEDVELTKVFLPDPEECKK